MSTESKACRVASCPAFSMPKSIEGYCPIHYSIATSKRMFEQALAGELSAELRGFAEDCRRGIYPKHFIADLPESPQTETAPGQHQETLW